MAIFKSNRRKEKPKPNALAVPLGFSIKSQLGSPSTLVNASSATNFTFKLKGKNIIEPVINKFNSIKKFSEKFALLEKNKIFFEYNHMDNKVFKSNTESYGNSFDRVLAEMLVFYYQNEIPKNNTVYKFIEKVTELNPINYDLQTNPYRYFFLMRHFLYDYALGMRAAEIWKQNFQASGGYLIVKEDGDIICYHFYFRNKFEEYLLNNTILETPSTTRHKFGKIYNEEGDFYLKLNLQIRFK